MPFAFPVMYLVNFHRLSFRKLNNIIGNSTVARLFLSFHDQFFFASFHYTYIAHFLDLLMKTYTTLVFYIFLFTDSWPSQDKEVKKEEKQNRAPICGLALGPKVINS